MEKLTQQGIDAYKAGNFTEARHYLKQALQQDRENIQAWLWLSAVVEDDADKAFCLRTVLRMDPGNETAQRGLAKLEAGQMPASPEEASSGQTVQGPGGYVPPFIFTEEELAAFEPFLREPEMDTAAEETAKEAAEAKPQAGPEAKPVQVFRDFFPENPEPLPSTAIQEDQPGAETSYPTPQQTKTYHKTTAKSSFSPWMWAVLGGLLLLIILVILVFIFVVLR